VGWYFSVKLSNFAIIRVTRPGIDVNVSFPPVSLGSGGAALESGTVSGKNTCHARVGQQLLMIEDLRVDEMQVDGVNVRAQVEKLHTSALPALILGDIVPSHSPIHPAKSGLLFFQVFIPVNGCQIGTTLGGIVDAQELDRHIEPMSK